VGTPPAQPSAQTGLGLWPYLRALLITCVLLVQVISATPAQPFNAEHLSRAEGERFVGWIESGLAAIGRPAERDAIKHGLIDGTRRAVALRGTLLAPFEPVLQGLASRQQWRLFLMSGGDYFRMHVEVQTTAGRDYHPVYLAGGFDRTGLEQALRYRRVRGIYNPSLRRGPSGEYDGFVRWLARELWTVHPEYRLVRVRMEHLVLQTPGSDPGDADAGSSAPRSLGFEHVRVRVRGAEP